MKVKSGYKLESWYYGKKIEIPEEWNLKELGQICDEIYRYPTYYNITYVKKGIPEIRGRLIVNDGTISSDLENFRHISKETAEKFPRTELKEEDIIFSVRGTMGKIALIPKNLVGANITANLLRISTKREVINPKFLLNFMFMELFKNRLDAISPQTAIKTIQSDDLKSIKVLVPSIPEQEKIILILSNIKNLIDSNNKIITQTKFLKQGLTQQLLTKGISHKKLKKVKWLFGKEIEIPEDWNFFKNKEICKKISVGIATSTTKYYVDEGVPLLRNQNIKDGYIDTKKLLYISKEFAKINESKKLQMGDVVCMRTGYPGKSAVVTSEMNGWQTFTTLIIRPDSNTLNSDYLALFLNSFGRKQIISTQTGAAQQNLNAGELSNLLILLPSTLNEQNEIMSIINSVNSKILELESKIDYLENLKKGLMQKLLTGTIRVKA